MRGSRTDSAGGFAQTKPPEPSPAPGCAARPRRRAGLPGGLPPRCHPESLHVYSWAPTTCWAWGQSDLELVPVPEIKAGLAGYQEEEVGVREPRERSCGVRWEEGRPGPMLCPQTEPVAFVTGTTPRAPETGGWGGCLGAVRSGRRDRAGSPGDGSARGTHHPGRRGAPQPPPGRLEGGPGGKPHQGRPRHPRAARTRVASSGPGDNGGRGKKG